PVAHHREPDARDRRSDVVRRHVGPDQAHGADGRLSAGARRPRLRIVDWPDRARVRARIPRAGRRHRRPVDPGRDADSVDWRRVLRLLSPRPARRGGRSQRRAALRIAPRVVFRRLPARTYRWQRLVRGRRLHRTRRSIAEVFHRLTLSRSTYWRMEEKLEIGSPHWTISATGSSVMQRELFDSCRPTYRR